MIGPQVEASDMVHAEKYRGKGETYRESCNREAASLQDNHEHYMAYRDARLHMRYMSAGRVQAAMGSLKNITPHNCFVMPTIHDSFTDGPSLEELEQLMQGEHPPLSIMDTAKAAAITMRQGGGVGYDISTLRPRGDLIRGVQSITDGPLAFAPIYDAICGATASAGNRRGAQMLVLRADHPDIEYFIRAKQGVAHIPYQYRPLRGFNMSIAVTDELMECVQTGKAFPLQFGGQVYREVDPHALWEMIMRGTYDWAEPGVIFIDTINRYNNLYYCENIAATNPCFTGDTKIWTANGPKTFKELEGQRIKVLTENVQGKLILRDMDVFMTARNQELVKVTLDDGTELRVTPQHQFYDLDRNPVRAKDLVQGQRLASVYRHAANSKGYQRLTNGKDNPLEHHVPFDIIPEGFHVHHLDGVKDNNDPSNLQLILGTDHNSMHIKGDLNPMRRFPEKNHFKKGFNGDENGRYRHDLSTQEMSELRKNGLSYAAIAKKMGCSKYTVMNRLGYERPNHKVVSVEWIVEREDVFCGTVEETHKFFVVCERGGVLVSNCGEQPLPPYGSCLLGSYNLPRYLARNADGTFYFQWELLKADIPHVLRAMDNVIDRARYPLPEQRTEAKNKRRIGLGVTGLANCIEAMGAPYGSDEFLQIEDEMLKFITRHCYIASAYLANEKGAFPFYDEEKYLSGQFIKSLDDDVRWLIKRYGIRNALLTSIAPTGTISFTADNVSSGIEPVFGYTQSRKVIMPEGKITVEVPDYGASVLGVKGKRAKDVTAQEHVKVLCTAQRHIDSAVSKTCNVPTNYPYEDFKNLYLAAYEGGAKGCTTYRPNGNYEDVITSVDAAETKDFAEGEACGFDPVSGQRTGPCAD